VSAPAVAEIRTERIILRPISVEDVAPFARLFAPVVVRFISDGGTASLEETAEWVELSIRRNAIDGFDRRSAVRATDGAVLGWCGIAAWNIEGTIERELGCVLAPANDASKHVAAKLGFAYERDAEFHGRTVELHALEV
jgi:RimJ/RimL family protein N-acetyltransferase